MKQPVRIGTRDSQLAVWQATLVKDLLESHGISSELIYIKSDGDLDLITPLYEIGVQGIFTKTLDAALLADRIDLAVHSMKDVPVILARGIRQAAILKRASYKDILIYKTSPNFIENTLESAVIATSSVRRKAQWLHRYPNHHIVNLRGNINTRLNKVSNGSWQGAIFAAAGVERIHLRPQCSIDLDWMLPAPAQGAIMVVCREHDRSLDDVYNGINDVETAHCVRIERDFLKELMGGCSTPISALAQKVNYKINFKGNIGSPDGKELIEVEANFVEDNLEAGRLAAKEILKNKTARELIYNLKNEQKEDTNP